MQFNNFSVYLQKVIDSSIKKRYSTFIIICTKNFTTTFAYLWVGMLNKKKDLKIRTVKAGKMTVSKSE